MQNDNYAVRADDGKIYYVEDVITISRKKYSELLEARRTLNKLYAAGVENWEWYEDALTYRVNSTDGT